MSFVNDIDSDNKCHRDILHIISVNISILGIISIFLINIGFRNYLLFHIIIEIFISLISFDIFIVALNTYKNSKNNFLMTLGAAYAFVGLLYIIHTLFYKGMGIFDSSLPLMDIATQLCLSAKYIEAISLLIACVLFHKSHKILVPKVILEIYAIIVSIILITIRFGVFPKCLIDGVGFTSFKIISEYVICLVLIFSIFFLFKAKRCMNSLVFTYMNLSILVAIISEIMFTLYNNHYVVANMIEHIFKAISFYFIHNAIIEIGLKNPYKLLFDQLEEASYNLEKKNFELNKIIKQLEAENKHRQYIERVIMNNEQCYNLLIESSKEAIFVHVDGRIIFANGGLVNLIRASDLKDIIGRKVVDLIPENLRYEVSNMIKKQYNKLRGEFCYETKLKKYTGEVIDVDVRSTCFNYNGVISALTIVRDISEKKQIEKLKVDFEKNRKKLNESLEFNKRITEFFSNISHELKTPLNVIFGSVQVLELYNKKGMLMPSMYNKYLKIIKQNCYRLLRLVNNIIDISKIDSGFLKLNLSNYNIVNVVEDITLSVADYIESRGVSLIFDTDIEEKVIACDPDKIERIMLNLLSNAIKFTNPGDEITVNMMDKGEHILISVKDTGVGIPGDKLQDIFERFKQVDKTIWRNREGSGIGLSLVKSLVELHGGNISIKSKQGEGTEFIIDLPSKTVDYEEVNNINMSYESKVERIDIEFSDIYM
ncbi:MASE3 domain-containing sensor histidine kinase [Clostridium thermopalmarium]|uniref:histidine kinase n=1 Tax=Clostridium thermopalmarium DSM 5974 TaxID=1121340 RepID=A0A2T0ARG9_9CLOT|nr:MASE3 domain-containing protein [Clostridium thermopalmarium]PRR72109.1 Sensor histidine kinase TodS [Clostridium thermopalmarium DSM 5974]PVZ23761.1 PAS domain S-box-containing protein [Clostridium thermopalmarium DSM 5974]